MEYFQFGAHVLLKKSLPTLHASNVRVLVLKVMPVWCKWHHIHHITGLDPFLNSVATVPLYNPWAGLLFQNNMERTTSNSKLSTARSSMVSSACKLLLKKKRMKWCFANSDLGDFWDSVTKPWTKNSSLFLGKDERHKFLWRIWSFVQPRWMGRNPWAPVVGRTTLLTSNVGNLSEEVCCLYRMNWK